MCPVYLNRAILLKSAFFLLILLCYKRDILELATKARHKLVALIDIATVILYLLTSLRVRTIYTLSYFYLPTSGTRF